mmetsp:Transcript_7596/g.19337  ORF Transcript_7596/g.19337 Transcript_7596/m.19337 type:complete len:248 (+) Transcript_7596:175-918(+)
MPMMNVVVTGGNSGLGLELCKQLHARGDDVAVFATCRTSSPELDAVGIAKVITGIDVTDAGAGDAIAAALDGVIVHCLINNAGGLGSPPGTWDERMDTQKFASLDFDAMRNAFELNTLGPLRVSKALAPLMASPGGKILIVSTLMASITDNNSGGMMAYRCSKAAVNMAAVTMSVELKPKGIAVGMVHPGMLKTSFIDDVPAKMAKFFKPVQGGAAGVLSALDALCMDTTGSFTHGNYGEGLKPCPW